MTGPAITYRAAEERRRWPIGRYPNGLLACTFGCETSYSVKVAKSKKHEPITIYVAKYELPTEENQSHNGWTWMRLKRKASSLDEAKTAVTTFLAKKRAWAPLIYRTTKETTTP